LLDFETGLWCAAMKPYVICHMCNTIDGRILGERWPKLPGGQDSAELFESTADSFGIGAWLVGTTTMREFAGRNVKLKAARRRVERTDHVADRRARRFAIGADAKGVLRFQEPESDGDHVVLLVSERVRSTSSAPAQLEEQRRHRHQLSRRCTNAVDGMECYRTLALVGF